MRLCCSYDYHTNRPTIQLPIVCLKADSFVDKLLVVFAGYDSSYFWDW